MPLTTEEISRDRIRRRIDRTLHLPPGIDVAAATTAVMCVLVDRLTPGEVHELAAALPESVRVLVRPCEAHRARRPIEKLDRAELIARVADHLGVTPAHAEAIAVSVFAAIRAELPHSIAQHVAAQLPRDIKDLWLALRPVVPPPGPASATDALATVEGEIETRTHLPRGVTAEAALTTVIAAFTARLSRGEARRLVLGLPDELRPLVETSVREREEPPHVFGTAALVAAVANRLRIRGSDAEALTRSVLAAVKRALPVKAVDDAASQLPGDLRELWLSLR